MKQKIAKFHKWNHHKALYNLGLDNLNISNYQKENLSLSLSLSIYIYTYIHIYIYIHRYTYNFLQYRKLTRVGFKPMTACLTCTRANNWSIWPNNEMCLMVCRIEWTRRSSHSIFPQLPVWLRASLGIDSFFILF